MKFTIIALSLAFIAVAGVTAFGADEAAVPVLPAIEVFGECAVDADTDLLAECPQSSFCSERTNCQDDSCNVIDTGADVICDGSPFCGNGQSVHIETCTCKKLDPNGPECVSIAAINYFCN